MTVRFGLFQADLATGELWKQNRRVELQGLPFQLLVLLLRRPGELVSRDELRTSLWPSDAYGEFDEGLNTAIRKVRRALGDDALNPRFVETLARRGYRFIAPVIGAAVHNAVSVAVLPFKNIGGQQDDEIFSEGLTEEVIHALGQFHRLRVTSRTSVFAFKGQREDVRKAAEALGVSHVLEGSVRKAGNRVRVNVQLIQAPAGNTVWSDRYDRDLTDIFVIQDEISRAISAALLVTLNDPAPATQVRGTSNPDAYQALLEGRYFCGRPSRDNLERGQQAFTRAIKLDPTFAAAYAGLATSQLFQAYQRFVPYTDAGRYAERAIELDSGCAEGYVARAQIRGMFQYNWAGAAADFARATDCNPSFVEAWDIRGVMQHRLFGHLEEALAAHEHAVQLDPLAPFPRTNLAYTLHLMGRHDRALEHSRATLAMFPDNPLVQHHACLIYHGAGLTDEAHEMARRDVASDCAHLLAWSSVAYLIRSPDEAAQVLATLDSLNARQPVTPGLYCLPCARAGDVPAALAWVKRAFDEHDVHFLVEFRDPCFDVLRAEPRFQELLRSAGLH